MATCKLRGGVKSDTLSNSSYMTGTWKVQRVDNIVYLQTSSLKAIPNGSFALAPAGTIPQGYRPASDVSFTIVRRGTTLYVIALSVGTDGSMGAYNYGQAQTGEAGWNNIVSWICVE